MLSCTQTTTCYLKQYWHLLWHLMASLSHNEFNTRPKLPLLCSYLRADSRLAPSQWETALLCNDVSYWLGANLESALYFKAGHFQNWSDIHSRCHICLCFSISVLQAARLAPVALKHRSLLSDVRSIRAAIRQPPLTWKSAWWRKTRIMYGKDAFRHRSYSFWYSTSDYIDIDNHYNTTNDTINLLHIVFNIFTWQYTSLNYT